MRPSKTRPTRPPWAAIRSEPASPAAAACLSPLPATDAAPLGQGRCSRMRRSDGRPHRTRGESPASPELQRPSDAGRARLPESSARAFPFLWRSAFCGISGEASPPRDPLKSPAATAHSPPDCRGPRQFPRFCPGRKPIPARPGAVPPSDSLRPDRGTQNICPKESDGCPG